MKTLNHRFRLKGSDPVKPVGIVYMCSINGKVFQYGVGYTIAPELWNPATKRPTTIRAKINEYKIEFPDIDTHLTNISRRIGNICHEVETFVQLCQKQEIGIDLKELIAYLDQKVKASARTIDNRPKRIKNTSNDKPAIDLTLISQYAKKFVIDIENGHRTIQSGSNSQKIYSPGTVKNYKGFLSQWTAFEKSQSQFYKWQDMNRDLYNQFLQFLYRREYSANAAGRIIKHWKVIAQAAYDDQIHINRQFREHYFKTISSKVENIYLTELEVLKLEELDLSNRPAWEKARDLFLMGCYTALRFSDIKTINPNDIQPRVIKDKEGKDKEIDFIDKITIKTKERVNVKVSSKMKQLLKKYNNTAPRLPEQKVNDYIKEIAQMAGIDTPIHKKQTIGGKDILSVHPKYELITTHSARRTAATLMYKKGMPTKYIMAITGHKTLTSFEKYICMDFEEKALAAADYSWFD
jgi:integrase